MAIAENIGYDAAGKSCAVIVTKKEIIDGGYKFIREHLRHDLFDECITRKRDLQGEELETRKEILSSGILKELKSFINILENSNTENSRKYGKQ